MDTKTRGTIKKAFYGYKQFLSNAVQSTVDWAESNFAVDYSRDRVQSSNRDGKENKLCAIIDDNLTAIKWCNVVEKTLEYYRWDCREKLIRKRYFEKASVISICLDIGICRATFFIWNDEILHKAEQWAKEYKLL